MKTKLNIWMSLFHEGIAHIYADYENGDEFSFCTIYEGCEYSTNDLKKMLNLPTRNIILNKIARTIHKHNEQLFDRIKNNVKTVSLGDAKKMGKYPDFKHRLNNRLNK